MPVSDLPPQVLINTEGLWSIDALVSSYVAMTSDRLDTMLVCPLPR